MRTRSHKKIARRILHDVDPRVIDLVNALMDNPPLWLRYLFEFGRLPWIEYRGHRARGGHTAISAIVAGYLAGRIPGVRAAGTHLLLDAVRDEIRRRSGASEADLAEDVLNVLLDRSERHNGHHTRFLSSKRKSRT